MRAFAGAVLLLAPVLTGGCARDAFYVRDERPAPRDLVRRHLLTGTSRTMKGTYSEVYRAAARTFDVTSYYSVVRDQGAIFADDYHGMSSVAAYFRPTESETRTCVEVLYLTENFPSFDPSRRRSAETSFLDDIERTLAELKGEAPPAPALVRAEASALVAKRGVTVSDVDSVEGLPVRRRPKDWAVIVGAERHAVLGQAPYAERDAEAFRRYARTVLGVPDERINVLTGSGATRQAVLDAVARARAGAASESRVWFYFAGHGSLDPDSGTPYLVPYDASPRYWATTTLPLPDVFGALGDIGASQVVAVLDASFSGAGDRTWNETDHPQAFREARPQAALTGLLSILYAAQPGQSALTLDEQGHGLLTYVLLRGMRGEAGRFDRRLDLEDLARYSYREVGRLAKERGKVQVPVLDSAGPLTPVW